MKENLARGNMTLKQKKMNSKDEYIVMNVAQNITEIAHTLENVLGKTEIIQELYANLRLLYSTKTMTSVFNKAITDIAGEAISINTEDLHSDDKNDPYWVADNKTPAKTSQSQIYERKRRKRKDKSI